MMFFIYNEITLYLFSHLYVLSKVCSDNNSRIAAKLLVSCMISYYLIANRIVTFNEQVPTHLLLPN